MLSFLSQLRWLPFTIPKSTEKKVDFVAVSWTRCFLFYFSVKDSRFADWDFVRCRACTLSVVLETPSLATASASTCTPATPPWLTGVYVFVCKCVPSRNKQMHFHISNGYRILGYALTLISKLSLFFGVFFFFSFQVLQQLRWRLSDWWGKGLLMFSLSSITRTMIAQSPVLILPQIFFSLCSVFLSSPPAGRDLDHHRVWENDGRAERDLCHPGEVYLFHVPVCLPSHPIYHI